MTKEVLRSSGYCFTCDREVQFCSEYAWLRDHFVCEKCGSIPRERALMHVIEIFFPTGVMRLFMSHHQVDVGPVFGWKGVRKLYLLPIFPGPTSWKLD